MKVGGVILCGGRSSRMGRPKALLPFGEETLLTRMVRILSGVVDPIVVVAAIRISPGKFQACMPAARHRWQAIPCHRRQARTHA